MIRYPLQRLLLPAETGDLLVAPDPVSWTSDLITVHWRTSGGRAALLFVSRDGGERKLVGCAISGFIKIDWIARNSTYEFLLCSCAPEQPLLKRVVVQRGAIPWDKLLQEISREDLNDREREPAVAFAGRLLAQHLIPSERYTEYFRLLQADGIHVTPVHFYQPIPDTRLIPESNWSKHPLGGIDMNTTTQLKLLTKIFPRYRDEYCLIPRRAKDRASYFIENGRFEGLDGLTTYCMVRHFQPRRIFEVGGGYSSLVLAQAAFKNETTSLITVEPYPDDRLREGFAGLTRLYEQEVQSLSPDFFDQLEANDILFIDSSHVVKVGGDVNYLFLEILPRLAPGVLVHVHDINYPCDYPRQWVMEELRFWTEQYLLQAFLAFNSEFRTLVCNSYLATYHAAEVRQTFPKLANLKGGSFWMRRKKRPFRQLWRRVFG